MDFMEKANLLQRGPLVIEKSMDGRKLTSDQLAKEVLTYLCECTPLGEDGPVNVCEIENRWVEEAIQTSILNFHSTSDQE